MTRTIFSAGALLLLAGLLPASAQTVRVAATVRVSDHVVASVFYGPRRVHVRPAPVVVVVTRSVPVVVHRGYVRGHGRAHARRHRELERRYPRAHRSHPPGLRVVGWAEW